MKIDANTTYDAIFPVYQQVIGAKHIWKAISDIGNAILGRPVEDSQKLRDFAYGLVTIIPVIGTIFNIFLYNVLSKKENVTEKPLAAVVETTEKMAVVQESDEPTIEVIEESEFHAKIETNEEPTKESFESPPKPVEKEPEVPVADVTPNPTTLPVTVEIPVTVTVVAKEEGSSTTVSVVVAEVKTKADAPIITEEKKAEADTISVPKEPKVLHKKGTLRKGLSFLNKKKRDSVTDAEEVPAVVPVISEVPPKTKKSIFGRTKSVVLFAKKEEKESSSTVVKAATEKETKGTEATKSGRRKSWFKTNKPATVNLAASTPAAEEESEIPEEVLI
jgi:hypothetical protein